ncbi:Tat pathway signal protein [Gordonibacter sp. An230]|nr:Tat pathway signal protein [Gordonibacter sp. An230]
MGSGSGVGKPHRRASGAGRFSSAARPTLRPSSSSSRPSMRTPSKGPARETSSANGVRVPTPSGGEVLLTRRHFLYGALGIGALAAASAGGTVLMQQLESEPDDDIAVLEVPEDAVTAVIASDAFAEVDFAERMQLTSTCELPYGSLVWANDDEIAACLLPGETGKPLTQVALLSISSGSYVIVLEQAVGMDEGFEVYDVRATSSGLVWTEADILDGVWRIYTARTDGSSLGTPSLVDEGNSDWETPAIAAVGNRAFWQVLPKADGAKQAEDSLLKRATMGATDVEVAWTSHGRMASAPYGLKDSLVITPRTDTNSIHYQLTHLDATSGETLDTLVLPSSMKPLEAGYGTTGFSFAFDGAYQYGDGISDLGTYLPAITVADGAYSGAPWVRFDRSPSAAPAWCGPFFMVKSTSAVCGVDLDAREWFAFDVESGADTYGEYLASTGIRDTVVTFSNIDDKPVDADPRKCCLVRVWTPTA